jgi:hypothetical protein
VLTPFEPSAAIFCFAIRILKANRESLNRVKDIREKIRDLASVEQQTSQRSLENVSLHEQQFAAAVSLAKTLGVTVIGRAAATRLDPAKSKAKNLGKTWAKTRIGSKSSIEGCKSRRINNNLD